MKFKMVQGEEGEGEQRNQVNRFCGFAQQQQRQRKKTKYTIRVMNKRVRWKTRKKDGERNHIIALVNRQ